MKVIDFGKKRGRMRLQVIKNNRDRIALIVTETHPRKGRKSQFFSTSLLFDAFCDVLLRIPGCNLPHRKLQNPWAICRSRSHDADFRHLNTVLLCIRAVQTDGLTDRQTDRLLSLIGAWWIACVSAMKVVPSVRPVSQLRKHASAKDTAFRVCGLILRW